MSVTVTAASAVGLGAIERFHQTVSKWMSSLSSLSSVPPALDNWPESAGDDPLAKGRASVERAKDHLNKALLELQSAVTEAESHLRSKRVWNPEFFLPSDLPAQ